MPYAPFPPLVRFVVTLSPPTRRRCCRRTCGARTLRASCTARWGACATCCCRAPSTSGSRSSCACGTNEPSWAWPWPGGPTGGPEPPKGKGYGVDIGSTLAQHQGRPTPRNGTVLLPEEILALSNLLTHRYWALACVLPLPNKVMSPILRRSVQQGTQPGVERVAGRRRTGPPAP